jgi:hypothetical protein
MRPTLRFSTAAVRLAMTTVVLGLAAQPHLAAHDMWIEPTSFTPAIGRVLGVKLRVGDDFRGEPIPRADALIDRFVVVDGNGQRDVVGQDGADPAGLLRVTATGSMVVGYQSQAHAVTLSAEKFESYLREQSLDQVLARRRARPSTADVRERFVRCAKSLVRSPGAVNTGTSMPADRALGLTLELVAEADTFTRGRELPFRVTYRGQPLAGARAVAVNHRNPWERLSATTDADGRVRFTMPATGTWMLKVVHMIEAPAGSGADWTSFWASSTFEVSAADS